MVAVLAIALPVFLAVLGVIVTFIPRRAVSRAHWVWVIAFIFLGVSAIVVGSWDRRNADAQQENLQTTINGLKDTVDKLTKPIASPTNPERDPDALYQNGNVVGKVVAPRITLNESKVYFDRIENAGNLNTKKTFEYRDYIRRIQVANA
jgi:hypothetical protein